jgi:hypothetical protein
MVVLDMDDNVRHWDCIGYSVRCKWKGVDHPEYWLMVVAPVAAQFGDGV